MEVALCASQSLSEPLRRGTPLPLGQLVEEYRNDSSIPKPLESKIHTKLKSNKLIKAEPPELHFSGFELEKDCIKILKLINISSEVMNIHIITTQTKYFQTSYTKKNRLVPGLSYTLKVRFCPDEWRYFYDCIRVYCKGDENLLIPVHGYPVISDLHIPHRIDLPAIPLGQSVCHTIPLRCSCPVDFEFQVYVIEPHEAFSVHPLSGVIPTDGEVWITVSFTPLQFETCQVTLQVVISQFNTKPYLCTITGSSAPHLSLSCDLEKLGHVEAASLGSKRVSAATQVHPEGKIKHRMPKEADKLKALGDQPTLKPPVDVFTHAGVAKMLIKNTATGCGITGLQARRMKEALFTKKFQQNIKEEQDKHLRGQVHLGKDPMFEHTRRQIAEEREVTLHKYLLNRGDVRTEEDFTAGPTTPLSSRVFFEAGQACEATLPSQLYPSFHLELRQRAFKLFQQAARKVLIQCRMNWKRTCLMTQSSLVRSPPSAEKGEEPTTCVLKISPDRIIPFSFPISLDEEDPLALSNLKTLPVDPIDATVTTNIPVFKLQVPQRYKLMGYQPVSAWEAYNSYTPAGLARPLRTGSPDDLMPDITEEEEDSLTFTAPDVLLSPPLANPLRIFNPAPGLQTYKLTPKYLESDLEFHLCPLPRYMVREGATSGTNAQTALNRKEVIPGLMTWKNFDVLISTSLSQQSALRTNPCRSVDYSTDILPSVTPPPLSGPPNDVPPLMDKLCESSGVQLTPEMIRAQFLCEKALVSNSNTPRRQKELQMEATYRFELSQMGQRVMAKLKQLNL